MGSDSINLRTLYEASFWQRFESALRTFSDFFLKPVIPQYPGLVRGFANHFKLAPLNMILKKRSIRLLTLLSRPAKRKVKLMILN